MRRRPVCEGAKPQSRLTRSGRVGPHHILDEPDEQRGAIFGGAWGEKGEGQGDHTRRAQCGEIERSWGGAV
jgi:hypothetical protein